MAELRNCPRCGKLFTYRGKRVCEECAAEEERDFEKVKEFLKDKPGATVLEVTTATGLDQRKVLEFIREGRLTTLGLPNLTAECEQCGAPITSGRLCPRCAEKLKREIDGAAGSRHQKAGENEGYSGKMHTADRLKRG